MLELSVLLRQTSDRGASDLVLKVGAPPLMRIDGDLQVVQGEHPLRPEDTAAYVRCALSDEQLRIFEKDLELDFAYVIAGLCRFRANVYRQRGSLGLVFRRVPDHISDIDELELPAVCKDFAMRPRGLVLVTGPAGCGKSTTLSAMVDYRNRHDECHIVTIEDPIEFVHEDKKALVNQRQLGSDTRSYARALRSVLRQDPDVILVGEMRDLETIALTVTAAETGHLVFGTMHTCDAVQTINRIVEVFPSYQQQQIRMQLSVNLIGVVSQVLLKRLGRAGRIAAFEVLVATSAVKNLVREGKTFQLGQVMQVGVKQSMLTLNQSLAKLVKFKEISAEEAKTRSPDPFDLQQILGLTG